MHLLRALHLLPLLFLWPLGTEGVSAVRKALNRLSFMLCDRPFNFNQECVSNLSSYSSQQLDLLSFARLLQYLQLEMMFSWTMKPSMLPFVPQALRNHTIFHERSEFSDDPAWENDILTYLRHQIELDPESIETFFLRLTESHLVPTLRRHRIRLMQEMNPWLEILWTRIPDASPLQMERKRNIQAAVPDLFQGVCASDSLLMETLYFRASLHMLGFIMNQLVFFAGHQVPMFRQVYGNYTSFLQVMASADLASFSLTFMLLDHAHEVPVFKAVDNLDQRGYFRFMLDSVQVPEVLRLQQYKAYQQRLIESGGVLSRFRFAVGQRPVLIAAGDKKSIQRWALMQSLMHGNQLGLDFRVDFSGTAITYGWRGVLKVKEWSQASQQCAGCWCVSDDLRPCSRCRSTYYCGRECQLKHWKTHRSGCKSEELVKDSVKDVSLKVAMPDGSFKWVCKDTSGNRTFIRLCKNEDSIEMRRFEFPIRAEV